jgi:protein-tyrosine phosphatase
LGPISEFTIEQLTRLGIPLEAPHRFPLPLTADDLEAADHVVAVKHAEHYRLVAANFPAWLEKVEFWAIDDIDCAVPDEAIPLLIAEVSKLANRLTEAPLANLSEPLDQEPFRESPSP